MLAQPGSGSATILSLTEPVANCLTFSGLHASCTDTGYLNDQIVGATDSFIGTNFPGAHADLYNFTDAFNNWNLANRNGWTLVNGGALPLSLSASVAVIAGIFGGGINPIIVEVGGYTPGPGDPSLSQLAWTQGLVINYTPTSGGTLTTPLVTLDTYSLSQGSGGSGGAFQTACEAIPGQTPGANNLTAANIGATASGSAFCDPIYPFQYGPVTNVGPDPFGDAPQGAWPDNASVALRCCRR